MADNDGDGYDDETDLWIEFSEVEIDDGGDTPAPPRYIGVPNNYVYPITVELPDLGSSAGGTQEWTSYRTPRYRTGDEWAMGNRSPNEIESINMRLLETGLIDLDDLQNPRAYGKKSRLAMAELMGMANATNTTWYEAAAQLAAGGEFRAARDGGGRGRSGPTRAPFVPRPPNREEVKRAYRNVRIQGLGGQWATRKDPALKAEEEAFAEKFEADIVGAQRAAYDGRAVEEPASLEAAAMDKLEKENKAGLDANRWRQYAQAMTEALGGQ